MPPKLGPRRPLSNQPVIERRGHRDYVEHNGRMRVVRVWDHHSASWRLSALGHQWARERQSEYVISIPVIMTIHRKDGDDRGFQGYMPASNVRMQEDLKLALAQADGLPRQDAIRAIKARFIEELYKYQEDDGDVVLS